MTKQTRNFSVHYPTKANNLMPVYTYRSFEDAERALWESNPGPGYYRRIAQLFDLAFRLARPRAHRGVFTYASIEQAQEDRARQLAEENDRS